MNFLAGVQRLYQECGCSGTAPLTVVGNTGESKRICDWYAQAWVEIQERHSTWLWMRKEFTFDTVALQRSYAPPVANFSEWKNYSFRIYLKSAGVNTEVPLNQIDWGEFRDYWLLGARKSVYARPAVISIDPSKNLFFGLGPNDIYTVSGEYFTGVTELAADADTPDMPPRFHMAIVYKAMMKYGTFESAAEVYQAGKDQYNEMIRRVELSQLPAGRVGRALI